MAKLTQKQMLTPLVAVLTLIVLFGIVIPYMLSGDSLNVVGALLIIVGIIYGAIYFLNKMLGK